MLREVQRLLLMSSVCTSDSAASFAGNTSESSNVMCEQPFASRSRCKCKRTSGLPWRPKVPRTRPHLVAPFARSIASRRRECMRLCSYRSRVIAFE